MNKIDYISLGRKIRSFRKYKNLSQEELASMAAISRTYMSSIESGLKSASLKTLVGISNALGISLEDIVSDSLEKVNSDGTSALGSILDDCSIQETTILLKSMEHLKEILQDYEIR